MYNYDFLEKGSGMVSPQHFVYEKMFLMLFSIKWPNFINWLHLLLEILVNMCITIVCCPGCDAINIEINLIFFMKSFFYMTKKSRQNFKYIENKKGSWGKIKTFFVISCTFKLELAPLTSEKWHDERFLVQVTQLMLDIHIVQKKIVLTYFKEKTMSFST